MRPALKILIIVHGEWHFALLFNYTHVRARARARGRVAYARRFIAYGLFRYSALPFPLAPRFCARRFPRMLLISR